MRLMCAPGFSSVNQLKRFLSMDPFLQRREHALHKGGKFRMPGADRFSEPLQRLSFKERKDVPFHTVITFQWLKASLLGLSEKQRYALTQPTFLHTRAGLGFWCWLTRTHQRGVATDSSYQLRNV